MKLYEVLALKYPEAKYVLVGDDYEGLDWLDESPKPSKAKLKSDALEAEAILLEKEAAKASARESAISKLQSLGLTIEEVEAAFGLTS